ncbi:MAG: hemolysin family protein [Bryobacteraceae bacterium]
MTESFYGLRFIVMALLLGMNGFFAAAEVSLLTARQSRLRQLAGEGHLGAQAAISLLANSERLLSMVQVGVTLCSLGLGWAGEDTLFRLIAETFAPVLQFTGPAVLHGISFVLAFLVMTFAHVVIGEVVPKNLALEKADRLASVVAPVLLVFYRISEPFVFAIERSAALFSKAIGLKGAPRAGGHSVEELKLIVSASRGPQLPQEQADMIHRVIDLERLSVREIMVPRDQIVSAPVDASFDQVMRTFIREQHSRLPVYEAKPEQIVGVLFYKDLLPFWAERRELLAAGSRPPAFRVKNAMRKPVAVPETKPVLQMLEEFRQGKTHIAMVVNEFGTIVGMLTIEDALEQVVGEIADEYDVQPALPLAETTVQEFDGAISIRDLETQHDIIVPSGAGFETLAGFLMMRLGRIPSVGDFVDQGGRRFTVIEMNRHRIARVRVEKLPAAPDTSATVDSTSTSTMKETGA